MSAMFAAAALLAVAFVPAPAFAEQAVGLEAQGVDPWAALRNGQGLYVRDELGRPVSAQIIERQLRPASAAAAAASAELSRLPKAKVIFRLMEFLSSLTGSLGLPFPLNPARGLFALPARSRSAQSSAAAVDFSAAAALALVLGLVRKPAVPRSSLQRVVALRC